MTRHQTLCFRAKWTTHRKTEPAAMGTMMVPKASGTAVVQKSLMSQTIPLNWSVTVVVLSKAINLCTVWLSWLPLMVPVLVPLIVLEFVQELPAGPL